MNLKAAIRDILGLKPFVGFEEVSYLRLIEKNFSQMV